MNLLVHDILEKFECIGAECEYTCCGGWRVDVDNASAEKYSLLNGEIGNEIKKSLKKDGKGFYLELNELGRCNFLNSDNLCEIYINLGPEHMCEVCKRFPRYYWKCSSYIVQGISMACPEAVRLFLDNDECTIYETIGNDLDVVLNEKDEILIQAMKICIGILLHIDISVSMKLKLIIMFNEYLTQILENDEDPGELITLFSDIVNLQDIIQELSEIPSNEVLGQAVVRAFKKTYTIGAKTEMHNVLNNLDNEKQYQVSDVVIAKLAIYYIFSEYVDKCQNSKPSDVISEMILFLILQKEVMSHNSIEDRNKVISILSRDFIHSGKDLSKLFRQLIEQFGLDLKILLSMV